MLKGDVDAAIETHAMYDHINTEHGFIPESFTPVCIYIYICVCVLKYMRMIILKLSMDPFISYAHTYIYMYVSCIIVPVMVTFS